MTIKDNNVRTALREQLQYAIQAVHSDRVGEVDVSNQSHNTIAETLHEFVFAEYAKDAPPIRINIVYSDGSLTTDFPLHCLPQRGNLPHPSLRNVSPIRASLISMRHLEMDALVDIAWLLNREVATVLREGQVGKKLATVEMFSYRETLSQLGALLGGGPLKLYLYQTGFQPVVVGFYRALIEILQEQIDKEPILEVTPFYFIRTRGRYGPGPRSWH
jgi:hypothetical protein